MAMIVKPMRPPPAAAIDVRNLEGWRHFISLQLHIMSVLCPFQIFSQSGCVCYGKLPYDDLFFSVCVFGCARKREGTRGRETNRQTDRQTGLMQSILFHSLTWSVYVSVCFL